MKINYDNKTHKAKAKDSRVRFLILHYTAHNFEKSLEFLKGSEVSSHYLIPNLKKFDPSYKNDELKIYNLVDESERAWHAGISAWKDRINLNDSSIGIEIVNISDDVNFAAYPQEQINLVIDLCRDILSRYTEILPNHVLGHSDIAIGRKKDPGPLFPWYQLYKAGIGAWFDENLVSEYLQKFSKKMPTENEFIKKLQEYGYNINVNKKDLFCAFQMHFRPSDYSGKLDSETAAIAYALWDKYIKDIV